MSQAQLQHFPSTLTGNGKGLHQRSLAPYFCSMRTKSLARKMAFKLNTLHFKVLGQGDRASVNDNAKKFL